MKTLDNSEGSNPLLEINSIPTEEIKHLVCRNMPNHKIQHTPSDNLTSDVQHESGNPFKTILFNYDPANGDPWNAYHAALDWAKSHGYAAGSMQVSSPTALFLGNPEYVSKWRNLSRDEQASADAVIEAINSRRFRGSDVIIKFRAKAVPNV